MIENTLLIHFLFRSNYNLLNLVIKKNSTPKSYIIKKNQIINLTDKRCWI